MTDFVDLPASPALQPERTVASRVYPSVDWPAVFAGAMVAVAVSFIAATFGSAIGLSSTSPYKGAQPIFFYIALGIWMIFVAVSSFAAGGYITGRMRRLSEGASEHERDVRDSVHGLVVWALAAVVGALLAAAVAGSVAKTAAENGMAPTDRYVDLLLRGEGARNANNVSEATRGFVSRLVAETPTGDFSTEDRSYLTNVIAANTGASQAAASERVNRVSSEMKADADKARKVSVYLAFLAAATLAVGAAAAWAATRVGGRHRDQNFDLSHLVRLHRTNR